MFKEKTDTLEKILIGAIIFVALATTVFLIFLSVSDKDSKYDELMEQGNGYLEKMDYENAETAYFEAIDIKPKEAEPYAAIMDICKKTGDEKTKEKVIVRAADNDVIIPGYDPTPITPANETELTPEQEEELVSFLETFGLYWNEEGEKDYDNEVDSADEVVYGIMCEPSFVDYSIYPGESTCVDVSETGEEEPTGWLAEGIPVYKYNASKVNWIAVNILNLAQADVNECAEISKTPDNECGFLHYGESYYIELGGISAEGDHTVTIDDITKDEDKYYVTYTEIETYINTELEEMYGDETEERYYEAEMEYKEIDGKYYWTIFNRYEQ